MIVAARDIHLEDIGHLGSSHARRVWKATDGSRLLGTIADRGFYHIHGEWITRLSVFSGGAEIARDLPHLDAARDALAAHLNRCGNV